MLVLLQRELWAFLQRSFLSPSDNSFDLELELVPLKCGSTALIKVVYILFGWVCERGHGDYYEARIVLYASAVYILFESLQILSFYEVLKSYMVGFVKGDTVTIIVLYASGVEGCR